MKIDLDTLDQKIWKVTFIAFTTLIAIYITGRFGIYIWKALVEAAYK